MNFSKFKHRYELDVVDIYYKHLKLIRKNDELSFFDRKARTKSLKSVVKSVIFKQRIDPTIVIKDRYSVIVLPENDPEGFDYWFALFLFILPSYKVDLVLQYYFDRLASKQEYLNKLEFVIIEIIESDRFLNKHLLLEQISKWVLNKREEPSIFSEQLDHKIEPVTRDLKLDDDSDLNRKSIHMHQVRQKQLFDVLCLYLDSNEDMDALVSVLNGENVKTKIKLSIKKISLAHAIYFLKRKEIIYDQVNEDIFKWIINSFLFYDTSLKEYTSISKSTLKKVFSGKIEPKNDDILDIKKLNDKLPKNSNND